MSIIDLQWEWDLASSPAALWPWVSDTDYINRTAGLAPVTYAWEQAAGHERRRVASSKFGPLTTRWVEHPFEWEEGIGLGVRREYLGGPARAYTSRVKLASSEAGGTRLTQHIQLEARSVLFAPLLRLTIERLEAGFARAYRQADAAAGQEAADNDLGAPHPGVLAGLTAEGVDTATSRRLAAYVANAPQRRVEHLRPHALADAWGLPRPTVLAACLAGCRAGVFEPRWALRCPQCRGAKGVAGNLAELLADAACEDCAARFGGALDRNVELAFRPVEAVRRFEGMIYCIAGPAATPHLRARGVLAAGEHRVTELDATAGHYHVLSAGRSVADVFYDPDQPFVVAGVFDLDASEAATAEAGGPWLAVALANPVDRPLPFVIEAVNGGDVACPAALAIAHPDFRRTFPAAALSIDQNFKVEMLAVLAWSGPSPQGAQSPSGGFAAKVPDGHPVWGFYDPLAALEAALALAGADRAIALDVGPLVASGTSGELLALDGRPAAEALAVANGSPPGTVSLAASLADDAALRFHLMMMGWGEGNVSPNGTVSFVPEQGWNGD